MSLLFPTLPSLTHPHSRLQLLFLSALQVCYLLSWAAWGTLVLSMACRSTSYSIVIIPLRTCLFSLDALRFYLWIKHLKNLEQEKDALYSGLEVVEEARLWYQQQLAENHAKQDAVWTRTNSAREFSSCQLRSRIQRVNGSLGSVMSEPSSSSNVCWNEADSDLRWKNSLLTQEVSRKNRQISMLESEKVTLQEELDHVTNL